MLTDIQRQPRVIVMLTEISPVSKDHVAKALIATSLRSNPRGMRSFGVDYWRRTLIRTPCSCVHLRVVSPFKPGSLPLALPLSPSLAVYLPRSSSAFFWLLIFLSWREKLSAISGLRSALAAAVSVSAVVYTEEKSQGLSEAEWRERPSGKSRGQEWPDLWREMALWWFFFRGGVLGVKTEAEEPRHIAVKKGSGVDGWTHLYGLLREESALII